MSFVKRPVSSHQTEIQIDADNNYYEVSTHSTALAGPSSGVEVGRQALKKAEISLNDCLACRCVLAIPGGD